MINNKFKLTAIAAAIVAMTACGSDSNNSSAAKPLNDALNSDAFKIASYTGMQTSESINGSWLIVSRGTEAGTVVAADINSGDKVELDGSEESAHVELIQVEEGDVEDSISVSFDCGDDDSTFYKVAENTYETGGDYDYDDGTYTSDFNEDGTCADDEDYCEKYTLTFSPNNVSAELSGEERFDNDGTAYIYNEGGSDYDSEGDNDFDADIFSKIDIPSRSGIEVIFEESYTSSEAGSLVKLSDAARVKFNADGLNYDGLYDKDDAESTFDDTHTASCFAYSSDGSKEVVTTTISGEEESIVTTTLETDDEVELEHSDSGGLYFERETESVVETGYSSTAQYLSLFSNSFNNWFRGEEEGFAGINTSNGDIFTMGDITLVDGILRVSGTVEKDYSNNMYRSESGEALLNINVAVDVSAVEDDIIEP